MYALRVRRSFSAAHAIRMAGVMEPLHGHDWKVLVQVRGSSLDHDGLLCDFHLLERAVDDAVAPFHHRNLNETAPFDHDNPTAERVARHIAVTLLPRLPAGVTLDQVTVEEAPGCEAVFLAGAEACP